MPDALRIVAAALLWQQGRLLICQRSPGGDFPNQWEFPGGKAEPGEPPEEALRRELEEELGIAAQIGQEIWRVVHSYPGRKPLQLLFFAVHRYQGHIENRVFQQVLWVSPRDLLQYDFLEADRLLIEKLATGEVLLVAEGN